MKTKSIFWGAFFITLGLLFLLNNFGSLNYEFYNLWKFWPAFIVLLGLALLVKGSVFKGFFSGMAAIVLALTLFAGFNSAKYFFTNEHNWNDFNNNVVLDSDRTYATFSEEYDPIVKSAKLYFNAGAGAFKLKQSTNKLFFVNSEGLKYGYSFKKDDDNFAVINFWGKQSNVRWFRKQFKNRTAIELNVNPNWILDFNLGASSMDFDLSQYNITKLNIDMGAASLNLKLGIPRTETKVIIDAGASSMDIYVPELVGCQIDADINLSSKNFKGFEKIKSGLYRTTNFAESIKKIYFNIDSGVSSISISRY
ncbi:MAG: hypothetical protein CO128_06765 [Ignavibacteriales bacterium CG_4_9_14_3_um_filter_30_11]|nr:MAG: hypothetical protein CO128_06765 [Ignavibacteriales bacterium CG_4_9_14_3_um_filter_30_11]